VTEQPAVPDVPIAAEVPEASAPVTTPDVAVAPEPVAAEPVAPEPVAAVPVTPTPSSSPAPSPAPPARAPTQPPAPPGTAAVVASDPTHWGRVDDDGTVWVRTSEGERSVGSYPGAEPPEALAYFGRKFDELAGQVALLEQRVAAGGVSPQGAETSVRHLREAVTDANAVGDLDSLLARLDVLTGAVAARRARRDAERAAARKRATATKERIVADAESLSRSTDWKRAGDRLRELLEEWKAAPRLDRKVDDALWKRFSTARTTFDKSRRVHFAELEEERGEAAATKEKLIKEAETLSTSKEWADTAKRYRELMAQWKATGRARRDVENALWDRFRAAQDTFFAARNEVFSARDADLAVNLETKQALLTEAEALLPVTDYKSARAVMRTVHERWEAAGHVPRAHRDEVENRLRKVDDAVRGAEDSAWARSNPEARARAEAAVSQLRSSIAGLEQEAAAARAADDEKGAAEAAEAAATRLTWLVEAEKTLAEFS